MLYSLIIIFGLVIGSFLNVCIYRIQRNESIIKPRSKCPNCSYQLSSWENIPILSYLFLHGKCSNCDKKISLRYPLVELLNAIIYVLLFSVFGLSVETFLLFVLFSIVIIISFIDIDTQLIPNSLLLICLIIILAIFIFTGFENISDHIVGAFILSGGFFLVGYIGKLIYKENSLGMGDVKYAFIVGFLLGWKIGLVAISLAFLAATIAIMVLFLSKKLTRRQRIPFGPFISIGFLLAVIWGEKIINWYLQFYD